MPDLGLPVFVYELLDFLLPIDLPIWAVGPVAVVIAAALGIRMVRRWGPAASGWSAGRPRFG